MMATVRVLRVALGLTLTFVPLSAQRVSAGLMGGVPLADAVSSNSLSVWGSTPRWTAGATANVALPAGFKLGADALYRFFDVNASLANPYNLPPSTVYRSYRNWDVPVYVRHGVPGAPRNFFVSAGMVFSHFTMHDSALKVGYVDRNGRLLGWGMAASRDSASKWARGLMTGAGVDVRVGRFHVVPEARYMHWISRPFDSTAATLASANANQVLILVSILR